MGGQTAALKSVAGLAAEPAGPRGDANEVEAQPLTKPARPVQHVRDRGDAHDGDACEHDQRHCNNSNRQRSTPLGHIKHISHI
jgi:hypothetical protein